MAPINLLWISGAAHRLQPQALLKLHNSKVFQVRRFQLLILIVVSCQGLTAAENDWEPFLKVGHIGESNASQFSDDGELIVTGASGDKATKLWNAKSGTLLRTFGGLTRDVTAVAISADKKTIATGDGFDVLVFDAQSGRRLQSVPGNKQRASGLALSADGKTLYASFREDSVTHQWDVETGKECGRLSVRLAK